MASGVKATVSSIQSLAGLITVRAGGSSLLAMQHANGKTMDRTVYPARIAAK
jgi:hypothetical protein